MGAWQDRRVRVVRLRYYDVLDWFTFAVKGWPTNVVLPRYDGLPDGVQVLEVRDNPHYRTIDFFLAHPSFDPVPEGQAVPEYPGRLELRYDTVTLPTTAVGR